MKLMASKFGIIISLFMIGHALFYPNKYSLIIAIAGYVIALISAVIYGLFKSNKKLPDATIDSLFDSIFDKNLEKTSINTNSIFSRNIGQTIQAPMRDENLAQIFNNISDAKEFNESNRFRESSWIKSEGDAEIEIPGYQ